MTLASDLWGALSGSPYKQETGWEDLFAPINSAKIPATGAPTWTAFGPSGNLYQYAFAVNDVVFMTFHIPHNVKPSGKTHFHVHYATDGTSTNTVKWELEYAIAQGHDQAAFGAPTTLSLEQAASATAWQHQIVEDATGITTPEVDSLVVMRLKRVTNGGSENADTVFGLTIDAHYERDRHATPNKAPDFY